MGQKLLMGVAVWYVVVGYSKLLTEGLEPTEAIIAGMLGLVAWFVWGIVDKKEREIKKENEKG